MLVPFKTSPRTVNFGRLRRDSEAVTKTVTITRGDGGPLKLELFPSSLKGIKTELREIEPGERYELEVTLEPPWPNRPLRNRITLATGVPQAPRSTISVYAQITPRLAARPSRLSLPSSFDRDFQKSATLIWDDNQPHKILGATINDPELSVTLEEEHGRQRLVLNVPAGYEYKPGARYITVRTDDKVAPTLKVPVTFSRRGKPPVNRTGARPKGRPTLQRQGPERSPSGTAAGRTTASAPKPAASAREPAKSTEEPTDPAPKPKSPDKAPKDKTKE